MQSTDLLRSSLQNANAGLSAGPELEPVVIVSAEAVFRHRIERTVGDTSPISPRSNLDANCVGEVVGATGDDDTPGRHVQPSFNT